LASVAGLGLRTVQRIEATGRASYESASAIAAAFSLPVAELRAADSDEPMQPPPATATERQGARRFIPLSVGGIVLAGFVLLVNPLGAISPQASEFVSRLKQQLCVYDEKTYSVGSTIRAVRGVDGTGPWMAQDPDVPILSCERKRLRARWEVIGPRVETDA